MRQWLLVPLAGLVTACHGDWRAKAIDEAEALVRKQLDAPSLQFAHVQFTGNNHSGQTCGYFKRSEPYGGTDNVRFISFIDGAGGQNPFIDDPSARYPANKDDFELNWRTQCVDLGYVANRS